MSISDNYMTVRKEIDSICSRCGRDSASVLLLPVSKTFPLETLQEALDSGISVFGENKVQEAREKYRGLKGSFSFHMIGHLQSNKAADAVEIFDLIHSIDKASTARKVAKAAREGNSCQSVLIQVNTTGEESKSGISPEGLLPLAMEIEETEGIKLEGLMTIGPLGGDTGHIRQSFSLLRELKTSLTPELGRELPHLSMGMSSDYPIAIEEGATILRVGSAIFGHRDYSTFPL